MGDHKSRQMLSSSAAADSGWFFVGDSPYKTIHFSDLEDGGQIEIRASNKLTIPGVSDQEGLFDSFTSGAPGAHGLVDISQLYTWLRFRKTTAGGVPETTEAVLREGIHA